MNFCVNSNIIYIIDDVHEPQIEPEKLEKENTVLNQYFLITVKHRFTFLIFLIIVLES